MLIQGFESELSESFEIWWPRLEERLDGITVLESSIGPVRTERDLLEEILNLIRAQEVKRDARANEGDEIILQYLDWLRGVLSASPNLMQMNAIDAVVAQLRHRNATKTHWGRMLGEAIQKAEKTESSEHLKETDNT